MCVVFEIKQYFSNLIDDGKFFIKEIVLMRGGGCQNIRVCFRNVNYFYLDEVEIIMIG